MIRNNIYNLHNKVNLSFILSFFFQTYDYFSLVRGIHPTTSILRVVDGYNLHVHTTGYGMGYTLYKHVYSTLLAVERNKPRTSILLTAVYRRGTQHVHTSGGGMGHTLHVQSIVHTAGGGKGNTCSHSYFLWCKGIQPARSYCLWKKWTHPARSYCYNGVQGYTLHNAHPLWLYKGDTL
jgi:hypothetical protein